MDAARVLTKHAAVTILAGTALASVAVIGLLSLKMDSFEEKLSDKISTACGHIREEMRINRQMAADEVAATAAHHQKLMSKLDELIANENKRSFWGWKKK